MLYTGASPRLFEAPSPRLSMLSLVRTLVHLYNKMIASQSRREPDALDADGDGVPETTYRCQDGVSHKCGKDASTGT